MPPIRERRSSRVALALEESNELPPRTFGVPRVDEMLPNLDTAPVRRAVVRERKVLRLRRAEWVAPCHRTRRGASVQAGESSFVRNDAFFSLESSPHFDSEVALLNEAEVPEILASFLAPPRPDHPRWECGAYPAIT